MKHGICYTASAATHKALQYIVVYWISEMSCYNSEYLHYTNIKLKFGFKLILKLTMLWTARYSQYLY